MNLHMPHTNLNGLECPEVTAEISATLSVNGLSASCFIYIYWCGGLVVGRQTCDLRVAGSRPGRDAAVQQP